jgi:hypothetical protein
VEQRVNEGKKKILKQIVEKLKPQQFKEKEIEKEKEKERERE